MPANRVDINNGSQPVTQPGTREILRRLGQSRGE